MKKIRICSLFLCLLMLSAIVLASCAIEEEENAGSANLSGEATENIYLDKDGKYSLVGLNMPEFNFTETEFRVCVYSNETQKTYFSEEIEPDLYDTTDGALNEAVRIRNDRVFTETGVRVKAYAVDNVYTSIMQADATGVAEFDAAMPFMGQCPELAQQGKLLDLTEFGDYIHLDAPWWDQAANETLSIAHRLFFTTGDMSLMSKICASAVAFNKQLYENFCGDYDNLYEIVRRGEWTFDLMYEMGKNAKIQRDDNPAWTYKDGWGLFGSDGSAQGFYQSAGLQLIRKDANDIPEIALGADQQSINYAVSLLERLQSGNDWFFNVQTLVGQVPDVWKTSVDVFGENRALFYGCAFSAIKKLRPYKDLYDWGLVPMPKASAEQEKYCTPGSGAWAYGICIPACVPNAEFSAYMTEMVSCYAKNYVTKAYYQTILKERDAKDSDTEDMLDNYIFANIVYELGVLYHFGSIDTIFADLAKAQSTGIEGELDGRRPSIESAINDCVSVYELIF